MKANTASLIFCRRGSVVEYCFLAAGVVKSDMVDWLAGTAVDLQYSSIRCEFS